jgi:hypothetical protein
VPLGPAQVHPHEHLGEVGRVDAAGAGADRHDRLALVVLTGEQRPDLELTDVLLQRGELALGLGHRFRVAAVLGPHLDEGFEVLDALIHSTTRSSSALARDSADVTCWARSCRPRGPVPRPASRGR